MKETISPKKIIPLSTLIDAKVDLIAGNTVKEVSKKHKISKKVLEDRIQRVDEISNSSLPALSIERKIISDALNERLKPIKEELASTSLEIIREADKVVLERIKTEPEEVSMKDLLRASDTHSGRLARITGIEEDPTGGGNKDAGKTQVYIQNIFNRIIGKKQDDSVIDVKPVDN